jgi:hypothetical protein
MFREAATFGATEDALKTMTVHFRTWLMPRLKELMVLPWAPHPFHPADDKRGYILNVYVEPSHRRRKWASF